MFLIIKVNVPIEINIPTSLCEMLAAMKNGQLKLSKWLEMLFTFVGVGDTGFHYKLFPIRFLKKLFMANLRIFSLLRDSEFRCKFLIFV